MEATIICRCEEIYEDEIRQAVLQGAASPNDIKRLTRCGAGPCQAKTCAPLVADIIRHAVDRTPADIGMVRQRLPLRLIPLAVLASGIAGKEGEPNGH